ncbi:MAG: NAD(P)/FAD-dependent oxidoreductase [Armatimonadota bacterium]
MGAEGAQRGSGPRIAILGGGPAGAFCALWLGALSRQSNLPLRTAIFDYRDFQKPGPSGCNMCAGVIPDSLVRSLAELGVALPERIIQRRIEGYHFHARGGSVDLPTPPGTSIYATFRGPGPRGVYPSAREGFDWWLLSEAEAAGATIIRELVVDVRGPAGEGGPFLITCRKGPTYEADIVVGAFGVNSNLLAVFEKLGFGYQAPRTIRARQAEIPLPAGFIEEVLRNRVVILAMGWPGLRFAAVTPKRQHVTVTLIGDNPSAEMMDQVLRSPELRRHFPPGWEPPGIYCACAPRMPVAGARDPIADRLVVIGDANVGRYLKNGIESSFHTARWAAEALLTGTSARALRRHYLRKCDRVYRADNRYGRVLFRLHDLVSRSALISGSHLSVVSAEQISQARGRTVSELLWGVLTGNSSYRSLLLRALDPRLQARLALAVMRRWARRSARV